MKKWMLCALVLSLLFCGCEGRSGKSPLVGKKTRVLSAWQLSKMDDKTFSKSWDDFSELFGVEELMTVPSEDLFELLEDLEKQKVSVMYSVINKNGIYVAFDVSSCSKKQKEEVEDILKDFCKTEENTKFYDTDHGIYYVGPNDTDFKKTVHNAEFQSWKKEECWETIKDSYGEPFFFAITKEGFEGNMNMAIQGFFPVIFRVFNPDLTNESKLVKYTVPLGNENAVKFKIKSVEGLCVTTNPQKCILVQRVMLDSKENAQKLQKYFTEYMAELAKVLDEKKVAAFLGKQKPKVVGKTVEWEFNAAWLKANQDVMEDFKDAVKEFKGDSGVKSLDDDD